MADRFDQLAGAAVERAAANPKDQASFALISEPRLSTRDKLVMMADDDVLWRDPEGEAYATITVDGHVEHHPIRSRAYKDHLVNRFARHPDFMREVAGKERPATANKQAIEEALSTIEAMARMPGSPVHEAALRTVLHERDLWMDLGDAEWRTIHLTSEGWAVRDRSPVPILRSRKAGPLPFPAEKGDLGRLRQVMPQLEEADWLLLLCWMVMALWPRRPYPILGLFGEQGSGKSTLCRMLRRLVDPSAGEVLQPPGHERDLVAAARHNRVLPFDNISYLSPELADAFCRVSTGAELGGRALYSDFELATFSAARPVIINGIPDLGQRGDVASRMIGITLQPMPRTKTEADLWAEFEAAAPAAMAAILDALVLVLRDLDATPVPQGLRLADCARIAAAAAPALGSTPEAVIAALRANANGLAEVLIEGDLLADAVVRYMDREDGFAGTAGELLKAINRIASDLDLRSKDWPSNARRLSELLRRLAPALRSAHGIDFVASRSNGKRLIRLARYTPGEVSTAPALAALSDPDACGAAPSRPADSAVQGRSDAAADDFLADVADEAKWEVKL